MDWCERARRVFAARDLFLLTPYGVSRALFELARQRLSEKPDEVQTEETQPIDWELVEVMADLFRALGKYYFRLQVAGLENVPRTGPALIVGNHNGGVLPLDSLFTALSIYDDSKQFGPPRLLRSLAHDSLFAHPTIARYARSLGALPARPDAAERLLRAGHLALVYPGSDIEACRPFSDRKRIHLAGRQGFLRLALSTGVPIVPVVSAGTHEQLIILTRGTWLARALRMHKLTRTDAFPLALALPFGITSPLLPYLPLPAQTSLVFGPPLDFSQISPAKSRDPATLDHCYRVVEQRMQTMLDELSRDRIPVLGKVRF